ncbi:hypothetical protein [Salinisphaera sp.]|uniref:hypothetical protein n=1 Tax=Salinisphaera sp. TaxID=1914330 RepID=UPI0025D4F746|nr:hypothetical protein [Salinisphaera sp.]
MSEKITLPYKWEPRTYQKPGWKYLENGGRRAIFLWHRRAGKDQVGLRWTSVAAHRRIGNYWHMLPTQKQGRKAVWNAINPHSGKRIIDEIFPPEVRESTNSQEMIVRLKCGSTWQVVGSDNIDSLVGSPPVGVVFSEFPLTNPRAYDFVRPILHENEGWAIFAYTPRGRNHGYRLWQNVKDNPDWFCQALGINETAKLNGKPVITEDAIQEDRDSGMAEELIEQEYYVSFDAPLVGAYYGANIRQLRENGCIGDYPHQPEAPVDTFWDIGVGDSTAIWFVQQVGKQLHIIDYYENSGQGIEHYAKVLQNKPYVYGTHWAPHDIRVREWGTGKSRAEIAMNLGIKFRVVPNIRVEDGIQAVRAILPRCRFNVPEESTGIITDGVERGVEALSMYRKEWDEDKQCYGDKPLHDWTSHPADAFRYMAVALKDRYTPHRSTDLSDPPGETFNEAFRRHMRQAQPAQGDSRI